MIQSWLRRFSGTPDEIARKIQAISLVQTATLASAALRRLGPDADEMPEWIEGILAAVVERMCAYEDEAMPDPRPGPPSAIRWPTTLELRSPRRMNG